MASELVFECLPTSRLDNGVQFLGKIKHSKHFGKRDCENKKEAYQTKQDGRTLTKFSGVA